MNNEYLHRFYNVPDPLTEGYKRELIMGYRVATTFIDAQVGLLLDALDKYGLMENTIVIIWGDHGLHLG